MILKEKIQARLTAAFSGANIVVEGEDGVHFSAKILAPQFKGLSRVAQQQKVYAELNDLISSGELHAIALQTGSLE